MIEAGNAVVIDVREIGEIRATGIVPTALHIPRAMIPAVADPGSPHHDPRLREDVPVILYCASGKRSELAGDVLIDLGFKQVFNLGGLKDWVGAGLPVAAASRSSV
jgi:rhodanese-related sulfurtransferase